MKLLVLLLALLALVVMVASRVAARQGLPARAGQARWLTTLAIRILRAARAGLALVALVAVVLAFKLLLVAIGSARTGEDQQALWVLAATVAGVAALFYALLWAMARLRRQVNQLHASLGRDPLPLLKGRWSF